MPVDPVMPPSVALIAELPAATAVAKPVGEMEVTFVWLELQLTKGVRFCVTLFLNVPVAVNCCVPPAATDGLEGVTLIEVSPVSLPVPESGICVGLPKALS